jgi:predicted enzyme related to lactoylglutathione lyase
MAWMDLTVPNAEQVKNFYQQVVGWEVEEVSMGDYNDYSMNSPIDKKAITGICHAKGPNADIPASWMPYFIVDDLDASIKSVENQGGEILTTIKSMGDTDRYVFIKDPAGAMCALYMTK